MTGLKGTELKKKLRSGQPVLGAWLSITDPLASEVMSRVGFDFLLIDTEHAPVNRETLQTMLLMFNGSETTPIVRVPWNDQVWIKWALDVGAEGVLVPLIRTAEDARQAVAACKYPLEGVRGFGPRAASNFYRDVDEYLQEAEDRIVVIVQIEHIDAVRNLDEILKVPGVDCVFIGPADLSGSLGVLCQWEHPRLLQAIDTVIAKAHAAGVPVGMAVDDPVPEVLRWLRKGVQLVTLGLDWIWMREAAAESLTGVRNGLSQGAD